MGRTKKTSATMINDSKTRQANFTRRVKSMKKKAQELSILCDIPVGMIFYNTVDDQLETWPENATELNDLIAKYRSTDKKKKKKKDGQKIGSDELQVLNERKKWIDCELKAVEERIRSMKEQKVQMIHDPQFSIYDILNQDPILWSF